MTDSHRRTVRPLLRNSQPRRALPPRVLRIIAEAAAAHGVTANAVLGPSRAAVVARARQAAAAALRAEVMIAGRPASYPRIGAWLGRHHATVMWACRAAKGRSRGTAP